jgi:hypothetical protein
MKKITIEFIPHSEQRLAACGDWYFDPDGNLIVRVSDCGDYRYNFLFARHEMDEAVLCMHRGITTEMVDADQLNANDVTDDPDSFSGYGGAVVQDSHNDALSAEWVMSRLLGVEWQKYGEAFEKIGNINTSEEDAKIIKENL